MLTYNKIYYKYINTEALKSWCLLTKQRGNNGYKKTHSTQSKRLH